MVSQLKQFTTAIAAFSSMLLGALLVLGIGAKERLWDVSPFTDKSLAAMKLNPKLRYLGLSHTKITDAGISHPTLINRRAVCYIRPVSA